jgi:hypothetical protein
VQFNLFPTAAGPLHATAVFATNGATPVSIYLHANDIVGVDEQRNIPTVSAMDLSVAPLPLRDHGMIRIGANDVGSAVLSLTDVLGRTVWEQNVTLAGIPIEAPMNVRVGPGFYILHVRSAHNVATLPVMIVR